MDATAPGMMSMQFWINGKLAPTDESPVPPPLNYVLAQLKSSHYYHRLETYTELGS